MRSAISQSKANLSAILNTSQVKEKKPSDVKALVTEKVIQVVPITLYSTNVVNKSNSVKKDNEIKNLLNTSKAKSYIVTKSTIIPNQPSKPATTNIKLINTALENNIKTINLCDEEESGNKNNSFLSGSKNSFYSTNTFKSDIGVSSSHRSVFSEKNKNSTISSDCGIRNEINSVNNEEEDETVNYISNDKNESAIILDDFLILEEKLLFIKTALKTSKNCSYNCWEWWNYSNYSELKEKMDVHFFLKQIMFQKQNLMRDAHILETLGIFVIYDICFDDKFPSFAKNLYNLFGMIYQNFLLYCEYFLNKLTNDYLINRLKNIIYEKIDVNLKVGDVKSFIRKNNNNIFNSIRDVLELYNKKEITNSFAYFLANLQNITLVEVNEYIKNNLVRKIERNRTALVPFDHLLDPSAKKTKTPVPPFIKSKPKKAYTLVLDLDETLIHLKLQDKNTLKGVVTFRPGLFDFLDEMCKFYELVVFTCGTVTYAEPIIDTIENKKTYFEHRLYRDHTQFNNGEYVKDLSLIGRDITRTIIVDNIPQNYRLQKENGIFIKSFYSENVNDNSLSELAPILKRIVENSPQDIRKELVKYKNDIVKKISTSLSSKQISKYGSNAGVNSSYKI